MRRDIRGNKKTFVAARRETVTDQAAAEATAATAANENGAKCT